tara:strand:+ start:234 stop:434 length:201 start_codon:yes stop_codon:yes gene_type:complete
VFFSAPTLFKSLPLRSRSADIVLGLLPSLDIVLSKPSLKAVKLLFSFVIEAWPVVIVLTVGLLAIA